MRVAVFEPWPRTCGVTKWAYELAPGFTALGHEAHVLSFTKSGRPYAIEARDGGGPRKGWRWWTQEPDIVAKWDDAPDVLDSYDLIVLNEPKNNPLDEQSKKEGPGFIPDYVWALAETKTPWMTAFHDQSAYQRTNAPFLDDCLSSSSFTGMALQLRSGAYQAAAQLLTQSHVKKLLTWPWLPYTPQYDRSNWHPERNRLFGIGGRMLSTKGFSSLFSVGHELPPGYDITSFGAESGGMGPCPSFVMFENLVTHHGWLGHRGDPDFVYPNRSEASIAMGNFGATNMVAEWVLNHYPDNHRITYTGPYMNAIDKWKECRAAVQLSTDALVSTFEYTTLEAMDAGCLMVLPRYYSRDMMIAPYNVHWLDEYRQGTSIRSGKGIVWRNETERSELIRTLYDAASDLDSHAFDPTINWKMIDLAHAPSRLANFILENV